MGSIIQGGSSIKMDLNGGETAGQAELLICRQSSSAFVTGEPSGNPVLPEEEEGMSRSHTGSINVFPDPSESPCSWI